jgi:hypothetical protein
VQEREHARGRPLVAAGVPLTPVLLTGQQEHVRQRLRRHLRLLHGWGVVCGLGVVPAGDPDHPWTVIVCPGYAIGPHGDEILVPRAVTVDLAESLWKAPAANPARAYVAVRYAEAERLPVDVEPDACGCTCREAAARPTRVRDCFAVSVLWEKPTPPPPDADLCRRGAHPCPRCDDAAEVVLACVDLPHEADVPITRARIHLADCRPPGDGG